MDIREAKMSPDPFEDQEGHFGKVVVVCVCGECHGESNDVLNDVFCAVSLSGAMWSVLLEETAHCGHASF